MIKIDDTKIPEDANMRRIYVTHKGFDASSTYRFVAMYTMTSDAEKDFTSSAEWGYPFVKAGTEYKIKVEYAAGWTVLSSHEIEIKATRGLGELWFGSPWPDYKFEDGEIKFSEETKRLPLYLGSSTHAEMYLTDEIISENFSYFYTHTNVYKGNGEWVNCENDNTIKLIDRTLDEFMYNWDYENNTSADEYYLNWIVMFRDAENKYGEYRLDTVSGPKFSFADDPTISADGVLEVISSERPNYKGIVIKIDDTKKPDNASKRKIYVSHKNYKGEVYDRDVAVYDYSYPNDYTIASEWGYPFVNAGTKYKIKVEYIDASNNVLSFHEVKAIAKSGLGELWFGSPWPDYKFEDGKIKFSEETKQIALLAGSTMLTDEIISQNFSSFFIHTNVYRVDSNGYWNWVTSADDTNTIKLKDRTPNDFYKAWEYTETDEFLLNWELHFMDTENKYGEYYIGGLSGPKFSIK